MSGNLGYVNIIDNISHEHGAATLTITLVLLFSLSLITLYGARVSLIEQKISANEYHTKQAFEAAQAGLEVGAASLNNRNIRNLIIVDHDNNGIIDFQQNSKTFGALANNAGYVIAYNNTQWPNNFRLIELNSTGWSDDHSASATLTQTLQLVPLLSTPPDSGITSQADIAMEGNIELINTTTDSNARAGGSITLHGGVQTITSTPGVGGIAENDQELRDLQGNDEFFAHHFGTTKTDTEIQSIRMTCDASSCTDRNDQPVNLDEYPGENIWVSGNTTIATSIGSEEQPVILIVDGDLILDGNIEIWGLIYVTQNGHTVHTSRNVHLHGALIMETANIESVGNLVIEFDQSMLAPPKGGNGLYAKVAGTWRDF